MTGSRPPAGPASHPTGIPAGQAATSALLVSGLAKSFGDATVLRDLDLDVAENSLMAILGASGGGKTTLLRLICGFERPDRGRIAIGGVSVEGPGLHRRPERRRIGYVAQDGALFPHLSVVDNVLFGLRRAARRDGRGAGRRAGRLLELVGLPAAYGARPPQALSGGEQQRVALARALAPEPRLVLLDEPFSALDAALRADTRRAVAAALAAAGATALLVTHDQSEALSMGDRVGVLRDGRLVQVAPPAELYRYPADEGLARFVGEAVLLDGVAGSGAAGCALGRLALARPVADGPVRVMVRPEQIALGAAGADGTVAARIVSVTYYGHDAGISVALAGAGTILARVGGRQALELRQGAEIGLRVTEPVIAFPRDV